MVQVIFSNSQTSSKAKISGIERPLSQKEKIIPKLKLDFDILSDLVILD